METHDQSALSRRNMVRLLAGGVAGGALLPQLARAAGVMTGYAPGVHSGHDARRIDRIGLQLYTVRSALIKDLEGTLDAIATAGITELEFAGYYNKDAAWWTSALKQRGFTAPATHEGMPATDAEWAPIFERAKTIGHEIVIVPSPRVKVRTEKTSWMEFAARMNTGAQMAKAAGLRFGFHNHDQEFRAVEDTTPYEILIKETDPSLVLFEMDIFWTVKAGQDPLALMKRLGKRIVCVHVKDATAAPELKMTEVGAGTIDFKTILKQGRANGLQHWFIEHDNPTDAIASITASAAAMKKL
jgi:sugar phosphate isomerase/epimerase